MESTQPQQLEIPPDQIVAVGPVPAKIMIVGEAPGETEVKEGKPFVGMSGKVLDGLLRDAGIERSECYITNVVLRRPHGNDFSEFYTTKSRVCRHNELDVAYDRLRRDCDMVRPNVIIALGDEALRSLTGKSGITKWRGSVLRTSGGWKCIPTIHPAAIAREWSYRPAALADLQRVYKEQAYSEIRGTSRTITIGGRELTGDRELHGSGSSIDDASTMDTTVYNHPQGAVDGGSTTGYPSGDGTSTGVTSCSISDARSFAPSTTSNDTSRHSRFIISTLDKIKKEAKYVAFDIETNAEEVTAIAFAPDDRPDWAICIPFCFKGKRYWSEDDQRIIWDAIKELLTDQRVGKIAQNGSYDIEFIERTMGFRVQGFVFDTMLGAHTLYMELPKGLDFLTSVWTDHPYYKDQLHTDDDQAYFHYNGTDAVITMEIATKIMAQLHKEKLWDFYVTYVHSLWEPLMEMQIKGVKFDYLKRNSVKKRVQEEVAVLQHRLDAAVGHPLNTNSPKQMKAWLYEELNLKVKTKKRKATGETTIAADEEAIEDLYKESGLESLRLVLKIRERQKILGTYLDVTLDNDKRIRCSYLITGTETGRLASRQTARGTGTNLQNVPPGVVRTLFIPDHGKVFVNADLSQAEARVVAYLANEQRLIRVFDEGGDIHRKNAANIFGKPESDVTDNERQLAKRVVHASNYGMGPITFARTASISAAEGKRLLNQYFATYPNIVNWQLSVNACLNRRRVLVNPFGRRRIFYNRYGEGLFKEGYAYLPQSTVADVINQGLINLHKRKGEIEGLDILLQVHDSILVQAPVESLSKTALLLKECLSVPVSIGGKILVIPVDIKTGVNWEDMKKGA